MFAAGAQIPLYPSLFDLCGVAFAARTLAASGIGALADMLIRRVVPANAATLAAYPGYALATGLYLKEHFLSPIVTSNPNLNNLTHHGYTLWTRYQPGSWFWPFQWIEGGWPLTLSALVIATTVWLVRRRAT